MGPASFGEYIKNLEIHFDNWKFREFSHPDFPLSNLNEFLRNAKQEEMTPRDFHLKRFQLRIEREKVAEKNKKIEIVITIIK